MAEYIERNKMLDDFELCNKQNPRWTPQRVKSLIVRANAADVVEVPCRCKDCKHWNNACCGLGTGDCHVLERLTFETFFCSYGERKEVNPNG